MAMAALRLPAIFALLGKNAIFRAHDRTPAEKKSRKAALKS